MKSPVELLLFLFEDLKRNEPDLVRLDRDITTVKTRFEHEGMGFLSRALPTLCEALDRGLADGQFVCPSNFKKRGALPVFLQGLLTKVFETSTGRLKEHPDYRMVKALREILRLFKKATVSPSNEKKLAAEAVRGFFQCDEEIPDTLPEPFTHTLELVAKVLLPTLGKFDPRELKPKHGPGTVAEKLTPNQKWYGVWDAVNDGHLDDYGFDVYGPHSSYYGRKPVVRPSDYNYASRGMAKVLTVPKDTSSRRTITAEPLIRQYVQQGLNTVLRQSITQCRVLRNCLDLTDQSRNQVLALEGSRTGVWATIDLSKASDRLSLKLVEKVFSTHVLFYEHMLKSRSPFATDGRTIRLLKKYAGMGNATTFPVQSVVFAAIAMAAILDAVGRKPTFRSVQRASMLVRVYGDDIIVPATLAGQVCAKLEACGLRVNTSKSFWTGRFRESCGVDAFMGVDVTPVYLKSSLDFASTEPSDIASHISASNHCWKRGLYETAQALAEAVEKALKRALPLVSDESPSLGWRTHRQYRTISRWSTRYQRFETFGPTVTPIRRRDHCGEYPALFASLSRLDSRDDESESGSPYRLFVRTDGERDLHYEGSRDGRSVKIRERQHRLAEPLRGLDLESTDIRFKNRIVWKRVASY